MRKVISAGTPLLVLAALLIAIGTIRPARAEIFVIESTTPALQAGSQLADDQRLSVPAGAHVRILLPSGKTQTVKGPYDGAIADIGKGKLDGSGMIAWLRGFLRTGGSSEATPGATRSLSAAPARPTAFSWTDIATGSDSIVCVPRGQTPQLKRTLTAKADRVTIVDRDKSVRGEAEWATGSDSAGWPPGIAIRDGAIYDIVHPDRPKRMVTLRVLPVIPEEPDVLGTLHARGCRAQFEAWLRDNSVRRR